VRRVSVVVCLAGLSVVAAAQVRSVRLDTTAGLVLKGTSAEAVTYKGKKAVHVVEVPNSEESVAIVPSTDFGDGTIELWVSGDLVKNAKPDMRGFVGVAFRASEDGTRYEAFYLRPTNGRADDQLRRNHATQYVSHPEYPWFRLRKENPGVYESYVDLQPGVWTKIKVEVEGVKARLFVNDALQPCLIVNDLKHGESRGSIALWIGPGTDAHFADLKITRKAGAGHGK
jgi:hypothetical protein